MIDGKKASLDNRGYVVDPFGTLIVDGFRQSHSEVAAFRFGSVAGSYAARGGDDRHVGVVGVALFDERGAPAWSEDEVDRRRAARPFGEDEGRFARPPF